MIFPYGDLITVTTRTKTGTDTLGNDVYSTTSIVVRGAFDDGTSTEFVQGQDQVVAQPRVFLPPGTKVTAIDQITVRGQVYDVDGSPNDWLQPFTGWTPGVEVRLKRVTG